MNFDYKERLEKILNTLLEVFDEHQVSPEDGALLSANLFFNSLSFLEEEDAETLLSKSLEHIMDMMDDEHKYAAVSSIFKPSANSVFSIGLNNTWGLDPVLLDEEH